MEITNDTDSMVHEHIERGEECYRVAEMKSYQDTKTMEDAVLAMIYAGKSSLYSTLRWVSVLKDTR